MGTLRIFSKANTGYSLTVRDGMVVMAESDKTDPRQHWIKDETYSTRMQKATGLYAFSLINKATNLALKHPISAKLPVQLSSHNLCVLDESILWMNNVSAGDGFTYIRMINNNNLNMDAFVGAGTIVDNTVVGLWEPNNAPNQMWQIVPYCKFSNCHSSI
ncbi:ricin B-like lectin EULS3 [Magnolia sinica]|uniref:ricin B-like lectin EULS3 n=1 Tax=Magnolia sinica TaxID=86752 RepID=UPI002657EB84|nr:ricin B-like lectin EULS3 [Magnolia sinica]